MKKFVPIAMIASAALLAAACNDANAGGRNKVTERPSVTDTKDGFVRQVRFSNPESPVLEKWGNGRVGALCPAGYVVHVRQVRFSYNQPDQQEVTCVAPAEPAS